MPSSASVIGVDRVNSPPAAAAAPVVPEVPPVVVMAIDFGTSRSSYAWGLFQQVTDSDKPADKIISDHPWADQGQKTRTAVLLDANTLECTHFGDEALQHYCNTKPADRVKMLYFEKFKMSLYRRANLTDDTQIVSADGRTASAVQVFGGALSYIRRVALERLRQSADVQDKDIRWVLTVPAIWSDSAKQLMRHAAEAAGIKKEMILALEPEAASLLCRSEYERQMLAPLPVGTLYMVLDCGGGTIDVTVHETLTLMPKPGDPQPVAGERVKPLVREVYKASGGDWGSTFIDAAFEDVLHAMFNEHTIAAYKELHSADWLKLVNSFELLKTQVKSKLDGSSYRITLPRSLDKFLKKEHGEEVAEMIQEYVDSTTQQRATLFQSLGLQCDNPIEHNEEEDVIVLSQAFVHSLMLPVINSVVEHARTLLEARPDVTYVFLVGGFSECPLLFDRVKAAFTRAASGDVKARHVVKPPHPGLSVLKGAVIYGTRPQIITHRIMQHTYGVQCNDIWDDARYGQADLARRHLSDRGILRCRNVLLPFVRAGDSVEFGVPVRHAFVPCDRGRVMEVRIFCSEDPLARFSDVNCRECGSISIQLPEANADNTNDRGVSVRMYFGEAEIRVELEVNATRAVEKSAINFVDR